MKKNNFRLWGFLSILGICVFFIALRGGSINAPFIRDEGEYAYSAWLLTQDIMPYKNAFMQKPPMIIYTYLLAYLINPHALWPARLLACFSVAITTILLGLIARREFGKYAGFVAMWLFTPMVLLPYWEEFPANTEKFVILPLQGLLACYAFCEKKHNKWYWFFAGIFSAAAFMYRPNVAPIIAFICIAWFFRIWNDTKKINKLFESACFLLLGTIVSSLIILWYFLVKDGWQSLFECTVLFNNAYAKAVANARKLKIVINVFLSNWWILFALPAYLILARAKKAWFYFSLFFVAVLCNFAGWHNWHSHIILMPYLALLGTYALCLLAGAISEKFAVKKSIVITGICALAVSIISWPARGAIFLPVKAYKNSFYNQGNPFWESPAMAERIRKLTKPDDYVFIAGSEPQILYYAKRKSPTRFVIVYPCMIPTPFALKYQKELIGGLKENPPKIIVFSTSNFSWLSSPMTPTLVMEFLTSFLKKDYTLIDKTPQNSLLLYMRKEEACLTKALQYDTLSYD